MIRDERREAEGESAEIPRIRRPKTLTTPVRTRKDGSRIVNSAHSHICIVTEASHTQTADCGGMIEQSFNSCISVAV